MLVDGGLELLTEEACVALLSIGEIGRVGVTIGALPAIFPVNYRWIDGTIMFRTAAGSKLSAATQGCVVAFEVDSYQAGAKTGWSVLAIGTASVSHGVEAAFKAMAADLEPWAEGCRPHIVQIRPELVTGRRIIHESGVDQPG